MKLITERDLIRLVLDSWCAQYPETTGENYETTKKLMDLNRETATSEEVNAIIGNRTWTEVTCDQCGNSTSLAVMVGQEPDDESSTAVLCDKCLTAAYKLLQHYKVNNHENT